MNLMKIGSRVTVFCLAAGVMLVTAACFHSGIAWIPEAFSFLANLFGI